MREQQAGLARPLRWARSRIVLLGIVLIGLLIAAGWATRARLNAVDLSSAAAGLEPVAAPARVEPIAGSDFNQVVLTQRAAERLDIQTVTVREDQIEGATRLAVPYSALIYGLEGETWIYTSPAPLTFIRQAVSVDTIDGEIVLLFDGPPAGTEIVSVGVAELYGTETGVGK